MILLPMSSLAISSVSHYQDERDRLLFALRLARMCRLLYPLRVAHFSGNPLRIAHTFLRNGTYELKFRQPTHSNPFIHIAKPCTHSGRPLTMHDSVPMSDRCPMRRTKYSLWLWGR